MDRPSTSTAGMSPFFPGLLRKIELGVEFRTVRNVVLKRQLENLSISRRHRIGFKQNTAVTCMSVDKKENAFLICGGANGHVVLTNLVSGDFGTVNEVVMPSKLNHRFMVTACQWFWSDIRLFITSSMDGTVKLWDLGKMCHLETFRYRDHEPISMHWNEHHKKSPLIAVANSTSNVSLLDVRSGTMQELYTRGANVATVRWIQSERHMLAVGSVDGKISIWDVRSARRALFSVTTCTAPIAGIRFSPCGRSLIACSLDMQIIVYDADTMKEKNRFILDSAFHPRTSSMKITALRNFTICGNGDNLMAAIPYREDILWTTIPLHCSEEPSVSLLSGHFQAVNACVYREDKQQLFSAGGDQSVLCWTRNGERVFENEEAEIQREQAQMDTWSDED